MIIEKRTRDERIEFLRSRSPGDVVAVMLTFMPEVFSSDMGIIHPAIAKLQERDEFGELLKGFAFVETSSYTYSGALEQVFNILEESRLLTYDGPFGRDYNLSKGAREAIRSRLMNKFSGEEQETLKQMADELEKSLRKGGPDDVIAGILACLGSDRLSSDMKKIRETVFGLQQILLSIREEKEEEEG